MLIPSKYENLQKSTLVLGANILRELKQKDHNIEELFVKIKKEKKNQNLDIHLNSYYNTLTFLWLIHAIEVNQYTVKIVK